MLLTLSNIQALFQRHDPSDFGWTDLHAFFKNQGSSYKYISTLLNDPIWTPEQARILFVINNGTQIKDWVNFSKQEQQWKTLTAPQRINEPFNINTIPPEILDFTFNTLQRCWEECGAPLKSRVWDYWGCGVKGANVASQEFMFNCMASWKPEIASDIECKIQALVGTFDEIVSMKWRPAATVGGLCKILLKLNFSADADVDTAIDVYSGMLHNEIRQLRVCNDFNLASVHTWRQLQGYPDFVETLGCSHPWMQSMCAVYTGSFTSNLPDAVVFRKENDQTIAVREKRFFCTNPGNPDDFYLAQAFSQYFLKAPTTPAPSVESLYYLLEGLDNSSILTTLFGLKPSIKETVQFDIDSTVFN